jgi:GNAT superfamily N-acetyltransferase
MIVPQTIRRPPSTRSPQLSDVPRLSELSSQLGYPVSEAELGRRVTHLLACPDHHLLLAETPPDQVVGWIHAAEQWVLESEPACEILGLVVDQNCRGQGIGGMLVAAIETWAVTRGIGTIRVRSNVVRAESHPFYERLGFTRVKSQHVYRKSLG